MLSLLLILILTFERVLIVLIVLIVFLVQKNVLIITEGNAIQTERNPRSDRNGYQLLLKSYNITKSRLSYTGIKVSHCPGTTGNSDGCSNHLANLVVEKTIAIDLYFDIPVLGVVEGTSRNFISNQSERHIGHTSFGNRIGLYLYSDDYAIN